MSVFLNVVFLRHDATDCRAVLNRANIRNGIYRGPR